MILLNLSENFIPHEVDPHEWKGPKSIKNNRRGPTTVSTSFLGIPHNGGMFETMLFGGPYDGWMRRCKTYNDAVNIHNAVLRQLSKLTWFEQYLIVDMAKTKPLIINNL